MFPVLFCFKILKFLQNIRLYMNNQIKTMLTILNVKIPLRKSESEENGLGIVLEETL